jgi:hypothetical protein
LTEKTYYSRKNVHSPYSSRSYEDEIKDVSKFLSETGVQLNFPRALEILLDFALFDIDEGRKLNMEIEHLNALKLNIHPHNFPSCKGSQNQQAHPPH